MINQKNNGKNSTKQEKMYVSSAVKVATFNKPPKFPQKVWQWLGRHRIVAVLTGFSLIVAISLAAIAIYIFTKPDDKPLSEKEKYSQTLVGLSAKRVADNASFQEKSDYYSDVLDYSNLASDPKYAMNVYKNEVSGKGYQIDPYSLEWLYNEFMNTQDFSAARQALNDAILLIEKEKSTSGGGDLQETNAYQQSLKDKLSKLK